MITLLDRDPLAAIMTNEDIEIFFRNPGRKRMSRFGQYFEADRRDAELMFALTDSRNDARLKKSR